MVGWLVGWLVGLARVVSAERQLVWAGGHLRAADDPSLGLMHRCAAPSTMDCGNPRLARAPRPFCESPAALRR